MNEQEMKAEIQRLRKLIHKVDKAVRKEGFFPELDAMGFYDEAAKYDGRGNLRPDAVHMEGDK
jgi:hypothetical protein